MKKSFALIALVLFWGENAFAAPKPQLYPNKYLNSVGPEQAKSDVNACRLQAEDALEGQNEGRPGGAAVKGAAKGAAKGALAATIMNGKAGRGAGAGAALGGIGAAGAAARERREGSPEYRAYVEACLEDKGYKVIGWK
ncbi:MAG: hypothetical protein U0136_10580 [Bdellovibrionota bacterium]